jgi:hypothetical protein
MEDEDKVLIRTYVSNEDAQAFAAHATEIGMGVATLLRVLVKRELRQYAAAAPVEPQSVAEELERR